VLLHRIDVDLRTIATFRLLLNFQVWGQFQGCLAIY
jgi:hypothetical protein